MQHEEGPNAFDDNAAKLMKRATYASVAVAVVLIMAKSVAWFMSDSVALLSSLVDSLLDAAASIVTLLAVRHALEPADEEHTFGHGKVEAIAGLTQGALLGGSSVFLVFQAIERLVHPQPVQDTLAGVIVMGGSIVLTAALVLFQRRVAKLTGSLAIKADSLHYEGDLLANAGVLLTLWLTSWLGWSWIDPVFAILVAFYIGKGAAEITRDSFDHLMDRALPLEERKRIVELVRAHAEVIGLHDLRTRSNGRHRFIQLHLELNPELPLRESHRIADEVEEVLMAEWPKSEVIIHQDPAGLVEPHGVLAHLEPGQDLADRAALEADD